MSLKSSLLLTLVATCLLICVFTTNAQDISGLTKCVSYGGKHYIQWTIATRTNGTPYLRARYIKKGGYTGWSAIGFRYGYAWSVPVADPDNQQQPAKMGEDTNPSTIYMVFRSPDTDAHYFYEMKATASDTPSSVSSYDYATSNVTVRSAVNGNIHLYFERDLIAKTNSKNYFNFNASRTDANLMFAAADTATISSLNDFANSQHNAAKILKYNMISETGVDAGSVTIGCSDSVYSSAMPAYRTPKVITEPTYGDTKSNAPLSQSIFFIAYILGALILGLFAYF